MAVTIVSRGGGGRPAIFLDKDGTVLQNVPYNVDPALMQLAPGASEGLRLLAAFACPLIVVSNQDGVARGRFAASALTAVARRLAELFAQSGASLTGFYFCPHAPASPPQCDCRKPAPGLLTHAASRHGVNPQCSWIIGDILDDIEAGHRAGCRGVLIDNGNETEWRDGELRQPCARAADFAAAAREVANAWDIWSGATP